VRSGRTVPLRGLAERVPSLAGRKIGLFQDIKRAARPILTVVERRLKEKYPDVQTTWYAPQSMSASDLEPKNIAKFQDWVKGVDAVVAAVGD
jgi:hypothetical protein